MPNKSHKNAPADFPVAYLTPEGRIRLFDGRFIEAGEPLPDPRTAFRAGANECVGRLNLNGSMEIDGVTYQAGDRLPDDGSIYLGRTQLLGPVLTLEPPEGALEGEVTWKAGWKHVDQLGKSAPGTRLPTAHEWRFVEREIITAGRNQHAQLPMGFHWTGDRGFDMDGVGKVAFNLGEGYPDSWWIPEYAPEYRRARVRGVREWNRVIPGRAP